MDIVGRNVKVEAVKVGVKVVAYAARVSFGDVLVERAVLALPDVIADLAFQRARDMAALVVSCEVLPC